MRKEVKRLIALSECQHLNKVDREAIKWALENIPNTGVEKKEVPKAGDDALFVIPLNSGTHGVTKEDVDKFVDLYPAVNVEAEIKAMIGWSDANKQKRKTKSGIAKFINGWLSRAQDQGGSKYAKAIQSNDKSAFTRLIEQANKGETVSHAYVAPNGSTEYSCATDYYAAKMRGETN